MNKNLKFKILPALFFAVFLLSGCMEEKDIFIPDGNYEFVGNVNSLKNTLAPNYETYDFEIKDTQDYFQLNQSTYLLAGPDNFVSQNGEAYDGEVTVKLKSSQNVSEWIGLDFSFQSENGYMDVLFTHKLFFRDGQGHKLEPNKDNPPVLGIPVDQEIKEARYFYQTNESVRWTASDEVLQYTEWEAVNDDGELKTITGYQFPLEESSWYALGQSFDLTPNSRICIQLPEGFTASNTTTYVIFKHYKTIVNLNEWDAKNQYLACNSRFLIPANEFVDIVSISGISGNRYFFDSSVEYVDHDPEQLFELYPTKRNMNYILTKLNLTD
nr:hypothetical protein [Saprospiraceae bacterium]